MSQVNRKEKEEIDLLRKELLKVQDDARTKESKLKGTIDRQKKQIEDLQAKNRELTDEVRQLEKMRIENEKNAHA